jgi:hypothetical protein
MEGIFVPENFRSCKSVVSRSQIFETLDGGVGMKKIRNFVKNSLVRIRKDGKLVWEKIETENLTYFECELALLPVVQVPFMA